jgi:hypothetical protein
MACGPKIVQYTFFAFNFLIWILGIVVLGVGIWSHAEAGSWKSLVDLDSIGQAANLLIAAGIIVAILGFLGCWGAVKKVRVLLVLYAVVVLLIFILEIAAGIYAYKKKDKVEAKIASAVKKGIEVNYGKGDKASVLVTKAVDLFQKKIKCCGVKGPGDYQHSYWKEHNSTNHQSVPLSCCRKETNGCNVNVGVNSTNIWNNGCVDQSKKWAQGNMMYLVNVGVVIAVVELAGIVCAVCLWFSFRKEECGERIE